MGFKGDLQTRGIYDAVDTSQAETQAGLWAPRQVWVRCEDMEGWASSGVGEEAPGQQGPGHGAGSGRGRPSSQSCHRCRSHWQVADPAGPAPRVQGLARCWGRFREVDRAGDHTWPLLMLVCLQPEPGGPSPTLALTLTPVSSSKTADQRRPKGAGRGPAVQFKIREWSPNTVKQTGGPLMF